MSQKKIPTATMAGAATALTLSAAYLVKNETMEVSGQIPDPVWTVFIKILLITFFSFYIPVRSFRLIRSRWPLRRRKIRAPEEPDRRTRKQGLPG